ncbi:arabinan endo-1,5-alpha-L-arabinosidase [Halostreptopolyspora alba]|uniref:Arabinan endo-1,5-alpha-L-arabinosidase n=1 Tax=Halostreptopolyspora alba TaxID=2487137 RepID=A0A3N0EEB1_9ACTN|nr:arabinan endo-1,5-alpha-L-arabinosidase [Nocardiopsaceae bacterium YIM 96095]
MVTHPLTRFALPLLLTATMSCSPVEAATAGSQTSAAPEDIAVHDPALVHGDGDRDWYVFGTGDENVADGNIPIHTSPQGEDWTPAGHVWDTKPAWLEQEVPGVANLWAPEVHEHDGTHYLYYAASTFGDNRSVIGLATNSTLDPDAPGYEWVDRGKVFESHTSDDFNAIDPGVVEDAEGTPWLAFGSFWSGIRMVQLEWPSGKPAPGQGEPIHLADRRDGENAIEAPHIVQRGGYYYLFVSLDKCCEGLDSTYRIAVGRSESVTGPYVDASGVPMLWGGATVILDGRGSDVAAGGQSVSGDHLAYHAYGPYDSPGQFRLRVDQLHWTDDGWPEVVPQTFGR